MGFNSVFKGLKLISIYRVIKKFSVQLMITIQKAGAQRLFDHPV